MALTRDAGKVNLDADDERQFGRIWRDHLKMRPIPYSESLLEASQPTPGDSHIEYHQVQSHLTVSRSILS